MTNNGHKADSRFSLGFFVGGILGTCIVFFLGTKEGKKTGKTLEKKGKKLLEELSGLLETLEHNKNVIISGDNKPAGGTPQRMESEKAEPPEENPEKDRQTLSHIEELQMRGRKSTESIRKRFFKNIPKKKTGL